MALTVPANATATVRLPAGTPASVREGGGPGGEGARCDRGVGVDRDRSVLSVGSGTYRFTGA